MPVTLPNILTVFRLLAAPGVALVFAVLPRPGADLAALVLFVSASVTDWLDGKLARAWDQLSEFGRMLDPVADKAMVITALAVLLMLSGPDPWVIPPTAAILLREVAVSGLREHLAGRAVIHVTRLAKWKTAAQMTAIAVLLFAGFAEGMAPGAAAGMEAAEAGPHLWAGIGAAASALGLALIWIAGALTLITGLDYFRRGLASPAMKD